MKNFRSVSVLVFSAVLVAASGCGKKESAAGKKYETAADSDGNCTSSFIDASNDIAIQARLLDAAVDADNESAALSAAKDMVKACDAFEAKFSVDAACKGLIDGNVETIKASDKKQACDSIRKLLSDTGNALVFSVERDVMQFSKSFE